MSIIVKCMKQSNKRQELLNRKIILFHNNNSRPHTYLMKYRKLLMEFVWEVISLFLASFNSQYGKTLTIISKKNSWNAKS